MDIKLRETYNQINYTSKRKSGESFEDFERFNRDNQIEKRLKDILCADTYVAEGRFNKIYRIPESDIFMIKAYKGITPQNIDKYQTSIKEIPDLFPNINVGQPIAELGKYILVMLKQKGEEHSISYTHRDNIQTQDINKYLSDIKKLAAIPQEGYNNFTDEVKELVNKNCYIDYFNSNNLMTTTDEINIVDIIKIKRAKQRAFMFPSKESLMKAFTDENILPIIGNYIEENQAKELGENIEQVSEKTSKAMKHSSLPENRLLTNTLDFLMDTFWHGQNKRFKNALENFKHSK